MTPEGYELAKANLNLTLDSMDEIQVRRSMKFSLVVMVLLEW
jgi:hypothetical protein